MLAYMLHLTRRHVRWATWAAIVLLAAGSGPQSRPSDASSETWKTSTEAVAVLHQWRFHTGDNMDWAAPGFNDSSWAVLSADRPWGQQGYAAYHGFAWYRRAITLGMGEADSNELLVPEAGQAYEVYWNGSLAGRCGRLPPKALWFVEQRPHAFPLTGAASGVLALRVWNAPPLSDEDPGQNGGFSAAPLVGTVRAVAAAREALEYQWVRSRQFLVMQYLLNALVALVSLLAWTRNREQGVLLWMAGFTLPSVLILILLRSRLPIPYTVAMAAGQPIDSVRDVSLWFLLLWLMHLREQPALVRATRVLALVTLVVNAVDGLLVSLAWHPQLLRTAQVGDAFITVVNTATQLFPVVLVIAAVTRHKRMEAPNLAVAISALLVEMVTVVRDASAQGQRFTHWSLRQLIDGPAVTLGGSAVSPMNILHMGLFVCIVYAVYSSFLEYRRREMVIEQELRHASEIQRVLIPDTSFGLSGFQMMTAYRPAQEVGGDFFQVLVDGDDDEFVKVIIGDVSGKGLAAAMSVSFLVGAIRALNRPEYGPAELLDRLNVAVQGRLAGGFATCLVVRMRRDGKCTASSAGHPGPFIDGQELRMAGALPLGILNAPKYEETTFDLQPTQVCSLYTDGLLEARDRTGEVYGFERLERLFAGRPTAEQVAGAAVEFGQCDDITVVMVTRESSSEVLRAIPSAPEFEAGIEPAPIS